MTELNGRRLLLPNRSAEVQRWTHPEHQVAIDIDYDADGIATITRDGLTALLNAAGWRRVT